MSEHIPLGHEGIFLALTDGTVAFGQGALRYLARRPIGQNAFFAPDFFLNDQKPWIVPEQVSFLSRAELRNSIEPSNEVISNLRWKAPELSSFADQFEYLQKQFAQAGWSKAVPICFETAQHIVTAGLQTELVRRVLEAEPALLPYGFWTTEEGMIGATPEILFHYDPNGTLYTVALAGTKAKGVAASEILHDTKERYEHQLVIDFLNERLSMFGTVEVSATKVIELPHLVHLRSAIQVKLTKQTNFEELICAVHPTPAVGGVPPKETFEWQRSHDVNPARRRFAAPFAYVAADGSATAVVAIRNVQWQDSSVLLGSGCGVTADSDCQREWQELALKRESVHRILGI